MYYSFFAFLGTIVVVWMVTSRLVLHAGLIYRMLTWMDLAIQCTARHEIGSFAVWKDLIPNWTQESLLTHSCRGRGTYDQPTPVGQYGHCHSTKAPFLSWIRSDH